MKTKVEKERNIKHIDIKVAKKIHRDLVRDLKKATDRWMLDYDLDAHADFCADVVLMMDIMIGQTAEKFKGTPNPL